MNRLLPAAILAAMALIHEMAGAATAVEVFRQVRPVVLALQAVAKDGQPGASLSALAGQLAARGVNA